MSFPVGWNNPVTVQPGQTQTGVDAHILLPSRPDPIQVRLDLQRRLVAAGVKRWTPIQVTREGVVWDGHHAVRVAAENGLTVEVSVVNQLVPPVGLTMLQLPVR